MLAGAHHCIVSPALALTLATTSIVQNLLDSTTTSSLDFTDFVKAGGGHQSSCQQKMKQMCHLHRLFTGECEDASMVASLVCKLCQLWMIDLLSNSHAGLSTTISGTSLTILDTSMSHYPWVVPLLKKCEFFLLCISHLQGFILQFV